PNSVTDVGDLAFESSTNLTSIIITGSVTNIGNFAFNYCTSLAGVYFQGNAPNFAYDPFTGDTNAIVYYLPGTTGWGTTFGGLPTALWTQVPTLQASPQSQ